MALDPSSILLTDRVAVVTGAANGLGRGIALALARFGADVALCDRDAPHLASAAAAIEASGRRALQGVLDVRVGEAVRAFFADVAAAFGRVDVLVNNAGGGFFAAFLDVNDRGQDALVRENFASVAHCIRAAVPLMPAAGGSIINVTSIEAHRAGPGFAVYSAMKAAVENLSKSLALELGSRFIRVNCLAPDVIPTPGTGPIAVKTPLPRQGEIDDVAGAAVFLACDLSRFVTGSTLHVDGGNWAAGGWRRGPDGGFET
ncbi:MAG: SDR family oxidoreductase [Deltaproteobacteria bacterium]|nr:SDR family oxidoreductase [Deltaproteobacteria bacterium]